MSNSNYLAALPHDFDLGNGWVVKERQHKSTRVKVHQNRDGVLARWSVTFFRCPSLKEVRVFHHIGAREKEMRDHMHIACEFLAKPRVTYKSGYWTKLKPEWAAGAWVYATNLGVIVDEASEFERLSIGLRCDDAIDIEFRELAKQWTDSVLQVSPVVKEVNLREK